MSQPVPEEESEPLGLTEPPADEHASELAADDDAAPGSPEAQQQNAGSSLDEPSDDSGHR